ncbi:MAG: hypothetical protein R3B45_08855 [Bdellovibrionota bacterium]
MRQIALYLSSICLSGCVLFPSEKRISKWSVLDQAKDISCKSIDTGKHIGFENISVLQGYRNNTTSLPIALIAHVVKRSGAKSYDYYDFDGDLSLESEKRNSLIFGRNGMPLVGQLPPKEGSEARIAVLRNKAKDESIIEIHNIRSNVVIASSAKIAGNFQGGNLMNTERGMWISLEGDQSKVIFIKGGDLLAKNEKGSERLLPVQSFPNLSAANKIALLGDTEQSAAQALTLKSDIANDGKIKDLFLVTRLHEAGQQGSVYQLELPTEAGVEAWAVQSVPGGAKLAYIEGDSLIGQANLVLAKIKLGVASPIIEWQKMIPLGDAHVAQPYWVNSSNGQFLAMMKWLDEESTLSLYRVGFKQVESAKDFGVFAKGTAAIDLFSYGSDNEVYSVMRRKDGHKWDFSVCLLGEIGY